MNNECNPLIKINIVGSDFTKITDCLEKCSVTIGEDYLKNTNTKKEYISDLFCISNGSENLQCVGEVRRQKLIDKLTKIKELLGELFSLVEIEKKLEDDLKISEDKFNKLKYKNGSHGKKHQENITKKKEDIESNKEKIINKKEELIVLGVNKGSVSDENIHFYNELENIIKIIESYEFKKLHVIKVLKNQYKKETYNSLYAIDKLDEIIEGKNKSFKSTEDFKKEIKKIFEEKIIILKNQLVEEINKKIGENSNDRIFKAEFNKLYQIKYGTIKKSKDRKFEIGMPLLKKFNKDEMVKSLLSAYEKQYSLFNFIDTLPKYEKEDLLKDIGMLKIYLNIKKISEDIEKEIVEHPIISIFKCFAKDISLKNNDELIVGHREDGELQDRQCKLYMDNNETPRFGNLVGIVRKVYNCKEFYENILGINNPGSVCDGQNWRERLASILYDIGNDKSISVTVRVSSRMDLDPKKPYFLLEMLTQGNLIMNDYEIPMDDTESFLYSCLLLFQMKKHLLRAYQKGVYHTYHSFSENGNKIKGMIDFGQHIKHNVGLNNGKLAYSYRVKSADNFLNHLVLAAYEKLKKDFFSLTVRNLDEKYEVKSVINLLRNETHFPKYNNNLLVQKCMSPISHPYYTEYEDLRKTCIKILQNDGATIMPGESDDCDGILYYVPDLWEEYLEGKMSEKLRFEAQKEILYFGDEKGTSFDSKSYPDYVFNNDIGRPCMILDAKYKPGWKTIHDRGKITSYYSEDYNKCIRDMNSVNAFATGVIFPYKYGSLDELILFDSEQENVQVNKGKAISESGKIKRHAISKYNNISVFYTIPIQIEEVSESERFDQWQEKLNNSIMAQVEELERILDLEKKRYNAIQEVINDVIQKAKNNNESITLF